MLEPGTKTKSKIWPPTTTGPRHSGIGGRGLNVRKIVPETVHSLGLMIEVGGSLERSTSQSSYICIFKTSINKSLLSTGERSFSTGVRSLSTLDRSHFFLKVKM
jgi:hypothetical protein